MAINRADIYIWTVQIDRLISRLMDGWMDGWTDGWMVR